LRRLIATLLAAALLVCSAPAALADTSDPVTVIDPLVCAFFLGGEITAEADTAVVLRSGWTASTRGQIVSFMRASTWVVIVDGTAVDVTPYLSAPTQLDRKSWLVSWEYPTHTLGLGDTMTVVEDIVMNHPNFDGEFHFPVGSALGGPRSCVITGAPPETP
jgi:hypothetical protein